MVFLDFQHPTPHRAQVVILDTISALSSGSPSLGSSRAPLILRISFSYSFTRLGAGRGKGRAWPGQHTHIIVIPGCEGPAQFLVFSGCFMHVFLSWIEERGLEKANRARAWDEEGREGNWRRLPHCGTSGLARVVLRLLGPTNLPVDLPQRLSSQFCAAPLTQGLMSGVGPWQKASTPRIGISLIRKGKVVNICLFCFCY